MSPPPDWTSGMRVHVRVTNILVQQLLHAYNPAYNNVSNSYKFNNVSNNIEYNNVSNSYEYNNVLNSYEYNNVLNSYEYNNVSNSYEYNNVSNSYEYNNVSNSYEYSFTKCIVLGHVQCIIFIPCSCAFLANVSAARGSILFYVIVAVTACAVLSLCVMQVL
jgi:hypothetical protein